MIERLGMIEEAEVRLCRGHFLTLSIRVRYEEGLHQDILGDLVLFNPSKQETQSNYAARILTELLMALQVDNFSQAKGKFIHVLGHGLGLDFKPEGIKTMSTYGKQKKVMFEIKDGEK